MIPCVILLRYQLRYQQTSITSTSNSNEPIAINNRANNVNEQPIAIKPIEQTSMTSTNNSSNNSGSDCDRRQRDDAMAT